MYVGYGALTSLVSGGAPVALVNPLASAAPAGSVAEAWAKSLAASFQVRMQKAGSDALGKAQTNYNSCLEFPQDPLNDPNALFNACVAPDSLAEYVGNAAMMEIVTPSSPLHQQMRANLSSVAGQYGAAATQGMIGSFVNFAAPLVAGIGRTKSDIISGNAALAWTGDLQVIAGAPQVVPSVMAQKVVTVAPQPVTSGGGTSSTTPSQVTAPHIKPTVAPHGDVQKKPAAADKYPCAILIPGGVQYRAPGTLGPDDPGCQPTTFTAACPPGTTPGPEPGLCFPIKLGPAMIVSEPPPASTTFQKALPWLAGAAAVGAVVWFATRKN